VPSSSSRTRVCAWACAGAVALAAAPALAQAPALTASSRASSGGLGPVKVGMTKRQAQRAARTALVYSGSDRRGCRYLVPRNRSIRAAFMLTNNRVARVDVSVRGIATPSGIRVGDSEAAVRRRFAGRLTVTRHTYTDGGYLEYVPQDADDVNRRVVFETTEGRVSMIRAGRLPEVRYIEGCS